MKILDCSTVESTRHSLAALFKTDQEGIQRFLEAMEGKISIENKMKNSSLKVEDILDYFYLEKDEVLPEKMMMFHLTSSLDENTFRKHGILNLESLIRKDILSDFFQRNGVEIRYREGAEPIISYRQNQYIGKELFWRFSEDNCVNGFLVSEMAEENLNIQHLKKCPEFIYDLSRLISKAELVDEWIRENKKMKLSVLVNFRDVNTFDPYLFIVGAVEYLILKRKGAWGPEDNYMVHLVEEVNIDPSEIVKVEIEEK